MAQSGAHSINLSELESAISSAVEHVQSQKVASLPGLARGPILIGRYLREANLHVEAERGLNQVAEHITQQVNKQAPGLNAASLVEKGIGGILIGIVFREE